MQAFILAMAFAALLVNPTNANPILVRRDSSDLRPKRINIHCAWINSGCPDCPDGYRKQRMINSDEVCEPESDDSPLLLPCRFAGTGCPDCPDGWRNNEKVYQNWPVTYGLKYCYPNGLQ
ncbi:hypothetical protein SYNPS1DRAFT_28212 [Syncephalis pseudoplumigaleata]|uniref:Uncharacterized protein n=1 Tax=Syncephalis pseudoplumigaleata TaxID=1712513 RepID=A0A4P9Z2R2_9FUNG|nr:hypothetical protein SYNPS1DRAFT_28212 [Syncephalis pseudoplumigaleata]|eukprot:RKP26081.1 hypothetical protein SYNPS1DRAFT_28212 [Syncephalis pseudoplumigaleata]